MDDYYAQLTAANLAGFNFKLYDATYNSVYVSSNGTISFGAAFFGYENTDLTSSPSPAAIAPLWDDLIVSGAAQSGVYWQVQGAGASQRLVVQWNHVSFAYGAQTGRVTFEAILNADGTIIFNYKNLASGDSGAEGASATVGIKDAGLQGTDRLLVNFNAASSPYVASGASLEIGPGPGMSQTDYYAYTLAAGQTATLAVASQTVANVSIALLDAQGHTLAAGISPGGGSGVSSAIDNFVAPSAGTYYAAVTGPPAAAYSLVVTCNADFGLETDGSFSTAQDISGTQGVLGDILAAPAAPTENWFAVNLTAGHALVLQTFTLGGAAAQFTNNLIPQIQVYDPSDALIASGQGSSNHALTAVAAATGAYRIRVLGVNSTSGEYFLSTTSPVPITSAADSGPGSLRQALLDLAGAPGLTHAIQFVLPAGPQVIDLLSPLPALADPLVALADVTQNVTIRSSTASAWDNYGPLTKLGAGTLTLSEAGSFNGNIEIDAGSLRLNGPATPTFSAGAAAIVTAGGTLELAGAVSALTAAVNIINNSAAAAGVFVSGAGQIAGSISGTGNLTIAAGSDLTVNSIQQTALVIGGTATSPATLTIAASSEPGSVGNGLRAVSGSGEGGATSRPALAAGAGIRESTSMAAGRSTAAALSLAGSLANRSVPAAQQGKEQRMAGPSVGNGVFAVPWRGDRAPLASGSSLAATDFTLSAVTTTAADVQRQPLSRRDTFVTSIPAKQASLKSARSARTTPPSDFEARLRDLLFQELGTGSSNAATE